MHHHCTRTKKSKLPVLGVHAEIVLHFGDIRNREVHKMVHNASAADHAAAAQWCTGQGCGAQWTIECQRRGPPHLHGETVRLDVQPQTPVDADRVVSAQATAPATDADAMQAE